MELKFESSVIDKPQDNEWVEALADAQKHLDSATQPQAKRSWKAVIRVIRANIDMGEPWPREGGASEK